MQGTTVLLLGIMTVLTALCFAVMLKLHENIHVILNNYISAVLKKDGDWVRGALADVFVLLAVNVAWLPFYMLFPRLAVTGYIFGCLDALAFLILAAALAFLLYENWIMYWQITLKRLLKMTVIPEVSVLIGGGAGAILVVFFGDSTVSIILSVVDGLLVACLCLLVGLVPRVRTRHWRHLPPKSRDWFETEMQGIYSLDRSQNTDYAAPSLSIPIDEAYGGEWVLYADVDGDGEPELISARNRLRHDHHDTTSVAVQKQDGTLLWHWGSPQGGTESRSYDVACQVSDIDGDGRLEVVLASQGYVWQLDGQTGEEKRRFVIAPRYCDMLMFLDASGIGGKTDILLKDRYHQLWVYTREGRLLYTAKDPGGYMLAHAPLALDLDGDGKDELLAGFGMLDHDGTLLWTHHSKKVALWFGGHADSLSVIRLDAGHPENTRLLITYCDAAGIALVDGAGRCIWEYTGVHFATAVTARLLSKEEAPQIIVDLGHLKRSATGEVWVLSLDGTHLATLKGSHRAYPIDWDSDGSCELLGIPPHIGDRSTGDIAPFAMARDFYRFGAIFRDGSGFHDVMKLNGGMALIYHNPAGGVNRFPEDVSCFNKSGYRSV